MSASDEEVAALVALAAMPAIGPATLLALREGSGAAVAWAALGRGRGASVEELAAAAGRSPGGRGMEELHAAAAKVDARAYLEHHRELGIEVLVHGDPGYPERLLADPAPPAVLFVSGSLAALGTPTVAIIGTRNATRLGCDTAGQLANDLARHDIAIVSGLALGIDGAAHRAVVAAHEDGSGQGGRPVAVVAAGLDHRYPRRHATLHQHVARLGAVVSEVPLGVAPTRWRFPARNRIIAGLADALVVVESRSSGGSMLTVGEALRRDRPILAVPGHPTTPSAAGTLDLICEGAIPLRDAQDVLVAIGEGGRRPRTVPATDQREDLDPLERSILELLDGGPANLAELLQATGVSMTDVSEALVRLEQGARIVRTGSWFELRGAERRSAAT